jgi:5-methyltetrahydrofolate--homocysteine methyltransferase
MSAAENGAPHGARMRRTDSPYLDALAKRVLVFDGAMGTMLMDRHLTEDDFGGARYHGCNEALVLGRPDVIAEIHDAYFDAGADVVETDSFMGSRMKLDEYGLGEKTPEINRTAARLARESADRFATPDRPRFVAGALGPTGMLISSSDPSLSKITFDELADLYGEQARYLVEGGVDLLLLETSQDLLEMKAAIAGITREFARGVRRVPIQAQATLDVTGRMLLGTDIRAVCATLDALPIDVIGLNCSTGPTHMRDAVRYLVENSRCFVSVIPNAGLPLMGPKGETIYPETPPEMARELASFVRDFRVNAIGGCCGTTPAHIRAFAEIAHGRVGRAPEDKPLQFAASSMTATALKQDGSPLLVGERINSQGSRKIKRLLLADDYDSISLVAREQVEGGAHVLDVCTALTERADEDVQMATIVKKLAQSVETPLMIDTTEPKVMEAALKIYAGRAIVNSVHLENGRTKVDSILPMVVESGSAVVALTIDEAGMAKTRERKLAVAERIYDIVCNEYGVPPGALIFDALTFTLATGDAEFIDSAVETIEGIRLIKARLPGVLTSLGVSNVSFGLKPAARAVLNSVMLHHCVEAGLDMALVHAKEIVPYGEIGALERELCDDLVLNRRPDALQRVIEHFENVGGTTTASVAALDDDAAEPVERRIHNAILRRRKDGIETKLDEALLARGPVDVLNNVLLPAMKEVGDKFGAGELILPFVLQSAEVMKKAVAHLEQFLEKKDGATKGKVVLATVFGDVHDIGKNLVHTILANNGYTVYDLGKQVPMNTILEKAIEVDADAIGLSALLVSTSKQMPVCVSEQESRALRFPVLIGGAAINREFGRRIAFFERDGVAQYFEPGVYYAKDAFEGLEIMDALTGSPEKRTALADLRRTEALAARAALANAAAPAARNGRTARTSLTTADVPAAPFFGPRTIVGVDPAELWSHFDLKSLYRLSWGGASVKGAEWERLVSDEFAPRLLRFQQHAEREGILHPSVVYGYFPAAGLGDDVIVYAPHDRMREIGRFTFARQAGGEHLCLADYLREPLDGGASDVIALQVVTVGREVSERIDALQAAGDYSESYFLHGFSVQAAEAMAEHTHARIRRELGLPDGRGKRYSWGYGACPDLSQHSLVWELLDAENAIGTTLTEAFQIVPEQSTAAIVMHHPQASYFNAAAVRELAPI